MTSKAIKTLSQPIRTLLLCAAFVIGGVCPSWALNLTIGDAGAKAGDTVVVPLQVDDATGILAGDIVLAFDPGVLTPAEVSTTALSAGFLTAGGARFGRLTVSFAAATPSEAGSGAFIAVGFKIRDNLPPTSTAVEVVKVAMYNGSFSSLPVAARGGAVSVASDAVCSYVFLPQNTAVGPEGGAGALEVTASADVCSWSATVSDSWISIAAGSTGRGSRTIHYTVAPNAGTTARQGTISISGSTFVLDQPPNPDATAPVHPSVMINGGVTTTVSRDIILSISAADDTAVQGYFISEASAVPAPESFTRIDPAGNYTAELSYTLSAGDGVKTVYVWFRDAAGNISLAASDTIVLSSPHGPTPVCGDQADGSGGPWTLAGSPYIVTCDVNVPQGKTLTVDPGVEVRFDGRYGLDVFGVLTARGTAAAKILFTSAAATPARGDWRAIYFEPGGGASVLEHCIVEYGGGDTNWGWANIAVDGVSAVTVRNVVSRLSADTGLHVFNSADPEIADSEFSFNRYHGINAEANSYPRVRNNKAFGNDLWNGITLEGGHITRSGTWYADAIPYIFNHYGVTAGNRFIEEGTTLTIEAGSVVKFSDNGTAKLEVHGTLIAQGTAEKPIVFTSVADDTYLGDTNNDGPSLGAPADWESIQFMPGTAGHIVTSVIFKYGGQDDSIIGIFGADAIVFEDNVIAFSRYDGLGIENASPALRRNRIFNNGRDGISLNNASPAVTGNIVTGNAGDGIWMENGASPAVADNELWGNRSQGVNNSDTGSCIDARYNWWGDASGPWDPTDDTGACPGYNPLGSGDKVSGAVRYDEWKTVSPSGSGPIQHWSFNEPEGQVLRDASPYGHTGLLFGAGRTANRRCGTTLSTNGIDQYAAIPAPGFLRQGTISGWVSFSGIPADPGQYGIDFLCLTAYPMGVSSKKDTVCLGLDTDSGNLYFGIYQGGWQMAVSDVMPEIGRWYYFAGTWGPEGMKFFVDGALKGQHAHDGGIPADTRYGILGANSWGGYADVRMDEIRIYNRALVPAEILGDMKACSPVFNLADAIAALQIAAGCSISEPLLVQKLDCDGDHHIGLIDALLIMQMAAGLR